MVANVTQSPLYAMYKDAGFSWNIAIWALLLNIVGISGQLGNAAVIWATYKTKSLHGTANFHLALGSFFEILHQNGHLLFLYITFSGQNFLSYRMAVYFLTVALFGMGSIAISITFTALDRLLYILFPMLTHKMRPRYYLSAVCAICFLCCCRNAYIFHQTAIVMPDYMITGSFDDVLSQGDAKEGYNTLSLACNGVTFAIYLCMGGIIKFKNPMAMSGSSRILKSIFVLITVNLSGFAAMRIYRLFIAPLVNPYMLRWYIGEGMSVYLNMSTASTGLVLYLTSGEYRNAFRKELGPLLRKIGCMKKGNKTSVSTITVSTSQLRSRATMSNIRGRSTISIA